MSSYIFLKLMSYFISLAKKYNHNQKELVASVYVPLAVNVNTKHSKKMARIVRTVIYIGRTKSMLWKMSFF